MQKVALVNSTTDTLKNVVTEDYRYDLSGRHFNYKLKLTGLLAHS